MTEGQRDTPLPVDAGTASTGGELYGNGLESGSWPTIARSAADEAHAEMLRAVKRGTCVLLADVRAEDGFRLHWSAWRSGDELHCHAWHYTPTRGWTRGPAFVVAGDHFAQLADLLAL